MLVGGKTLISQIMRDVMTKTCIITPFMVLKISLTPPDIWNKSNYYSAGKLAHLKSHITGSAQAGVFLRYYDIIDAGFHTSGTKLNTA